MSMPQQIRSAGERVALGAVGGFTPVLLNLALVDAGTVLANLSVLAAVSYLVRVVALVALGALVAWLHDDEHKRVRAFELGLAAPAIVMGVLNGVALRAEGQRAGLSLATPVHAAQQVETFERAEESSKQQVLRGLLGVRPRLPEWIVSVYSGERAAALERARRLEHRYPDLEFLVFQPSMGLSAWVVTIGGQMTQAEATRRLAAARERNIVGAALQRIPRQK